MSATNRGGEKIDKDYYITPLKTVRDFLNKFKQLELEFDFEKNTFLDPCAGGDELNEMIYPKVLKEFGAKNIKTLDIRKDSKANIICDYLNTDIKIKYDAIFTNPPFGLAMPFIEKSFLDVKEGGYIGMLLRINFYGSIKRQSFWNNKMPKYTLLHSKRPSFTKFGTDATEYAHFIWQKGFSPSSSNLFII